MTHSELTELQIEISELEKENQDLKDRVKELEINITYLTSKVEANTDSTKVIAEKVQKTDSVVH